MVLITQAKLRQHIRRGRLRTGARRLGLAALLVAIACAVVACADEEASPVAAQRRAAEAMLDDGTTVEVVPGVVSRADETEVVLRAAAPVARVSVRRGPEAEGALVLQIDNVHAEAELVPVAVEAVSAASIPGCPSGQQSSTAVVCEEGDEIANCQQPSTRRPSATSLRAALEIAPCTGVEYRVRLPEAREAGPLAFAAVGSTDGLQIFDRIAARLEGEEIDFLVVLGDNAASAERRALSSLREKLDELAVPSVMVAGEVEDDVDEGEYFAGIFGPQDFSFTLAGAQFVAFRSAGQQLGVGGVARLERFLSELERRRSDASTPTVALTHVAPLDPVEVRGQGLLDPVEAGRVTSILVERGVDLLLAGHLVDNARAEMGGLEVVVTSAEAGLLEGEGEFVVVEIGAGGEIEVRSEGLGD